MLACEKIGIMSRISRGLYQSLITEALAKEIGSLETNLHARYGDLHYSEVADRLAMHVSHVIARAVESIEDGRRVGDGIALARELISRIVETTAADLLSERPAIPGQFLTGVLAIQPDGRPEGLSEPLIRSLRMPQASRASVTKLLPKFRQPTASILLWPLYASVASDRCWMPYVAIVRPGVS